LAEVNLDCTARTADAQYQYFGTRINPRTFADWIADISSVLAAGQRAWLSGHHNLHSLFLLRYDDHVRQFYKRCNDCYIDGMPVRLILRGFGVPTSAAQRFSLMDYFMELLGHAERMNWSVFYLGSQPSVVSAGRALIQATFPALRIQFQHGHSPDNSAIVDRINEFRPDILLVGMGMPLQERWILEHLDQLDVGFVTQAGGTLDYYTGAQAKPPLWLSRVGFAWLYRLLHDPARLWRRYLLEPFALIYPTVRQWYRHGKSH
jgi:N-acetylglucosaminyldiphosphoundecaprenol N-acetyl-beta-D-mannosaminyltransferase